MRNKHYQAHFKNHKHKITALTILLLAVVLFALLGLFVGSSNMSLKEGLKALFGSGDSAVNTRIIWNIRIPRIIAAIVAGAGLSMAGLIMQTTLNNTMASPSTLGVSNAAVFGANVSIIAFSGGFVTTGNNLTNYVSAVNPFAASLMAFVFAMLSVLVILGLCKIRSFSPNVVVLAGIAMGAMWTAGTTLLQFYATDVGLSAAVIWNFGDLGRATYRTDLIMFLITAAAAVYFRLMAWKYNALMTGDAPAGTMGVNVGRLRFISLLISSLVTAACVSFLGMIGFVGIICPHVIKLILGHDHRYSVPASILSGSLLLLIADTVSRSIGSGSALPVGAITTLLGAPFFLAIIFAGRGNR